MERGFQVVINTSLNGIDLLTLHLDTCTQKSVNASSTIASQPLQDANTLSDHMWRNPDTLNLSGTFGLYGNTNGDYDNLVDIENHTDRLANIEELFEHIKDFGLLCNITTLHEESNGEVRFKIRKNMVLHTIQWVEHQSTLQYTFGFQEIMSMDIQDTPIVNPYDEDLPNIFMPESRSLNQILTDNNSNAVEETLTRILMNQNFIDKYCAALAAANTKGNLKDYYTGVGVGLAVGVAGLAIVGSVAISMGISAIVTSAAAIAAGTTTALAVFGAAAGAIFPVGTIIVGTIAVVAMMVGVISTIIKAVKRNKEKQRLKKAFKFYKNYEQYIDSETGRIDIEKALSDPTVTLNIDEINRWNNLLVACRNAVAAINDDTKFYNISNSEDDNNDREVAIVIENQIYYITFKFDKQAKKWNWSVQTVNDDGEYVSLNGRNGFMYNSNVYATSMNQCDLDHCFFKDITNTYGVYIVNPSSALNETQDAQDNVNSKLASFQVVVAKDNAIKQFVEKMDNVILELLKSEGFEFNS